MAVIYPTIFTKTSDDEDTYLVEIPDLNGATEGHGLDDAIKMARDYIGCYFLTGEKEAPTPTLLNDIDITKSEFYEEGRSMLSLVDLDIDEYKKRISNRSVRRNVSIPEWLDAAANEAHLNVSRVLQDALKDKLGVN